MVPIRRIDEIKEAVGRQSTHEESEKECLPGVCQQPAMEYQKIMLIGPRVIATGLDIFIINFHIDILSDLRSAVNSQKFFLPSFTGSIFQ